MALAFKKMHEHFIEEFEHVLTNGCGRIRMVAVDDFKFLHVSFVHPAPSWTGKTFRGSSSTCSLSHRATMFPAACGLLQASGVPRGRHRELVGMAASKLRSASWRSNAKTARPLGGPPADPNTIVLARSSSWSPYDLEKGQHQAEATAVILEAML